MSRVQSLLGFLADGKWHQKVPVETDQRTVQHCIKQGLVRTKCTQPEKKRRGEGYRIAFRITAKGKHRIAPA